MMPTDFSIPAGRITKPTELDTLLRICVGFQPMSSALRIVCAANLGVAIVSRTLAPLFSSDTI